MDSGDGRAAEEAHRERVPGVGGGAGLGTLARFGDRAGASERAGELSQQGETEPLNGQQAEAQGGIDAQGGTKAQGEGQTCEACGQARGATEGPSEAEAKLASGSDQAEGNTHPEAVDDPTGSGEVEPGAAGSVLVAFGGRARGPGDVRSGDGESRFSLVQGTSGEGVLPAAGEVVSLADAKAALEAEDEGDERHINGEAHCHSCGHTWEAVAPVGSVELQCPECNRMWGLFSTPISPGIHWTCHCGEGLFYLRPEGAMCRACGTYAHGWE